MIVMRPLTSQITISQPEEPTSRAMSADTMKMPEPIIEPATSMVASNRPSLRWNAPAAGAASWVTAGSVMQIPSERGSRPGYPIVPAAQRLFAVHDQRHRTVVDQLDLHVGAELAGRHRHAERLDGV